MGDQPPIRQQMTHKRWPQILVDEYMFIIYDSGMTDRVSVANLDGFDWSGGNAEKNWKRHGVAPAEEEQVFFNTPLLWGEDAAHSDTERRFYALGQTDEGRALFIAFTMRARRLRVVSARDMSRKERRAYRS